MDTSKVTFRLIQNIQKVLLDHGDEIAYIKRNLKEIKGYFSPKMLIIYFGFKKDNVCDELVILNDGSQIEATDVLSYESGISTIKMCNGQWMYTPTINIKMVKPIEK